MQTKFVVSHDGQELGPLTEAEIKAMLLGNQLLPIDYLYDESKQDWVLLTERFDLKLLDSEVVQTQPMPVMPAAVAPAPVAPAPVTPVPVTPTPLLPRTPTPEPSTSVIALSAPYPEAPDAPPPQVVVQRRGANGSAKSSFSPAASAPANSTPGHANRISFAGGVGVISLKQLRAGKINLRLKECSDKALQLTADVTVNVKAGPARQIRLSSPKSVRAGEEFALEFAAYDDFDNPTTEFHGELAMEWVGSHSQSHPVIFKNGLAQLRFKPTTAETVKLRFSGTDKSLKLPEDLTIEIRAGQAAQLIIEGPQDAVAGQDMPVTVRAVDAFGNLATDFKGELALGIAIEPASGDKRAS